MSKKTKYKKEVQCVYWKDGICILPPLLDKKANEQEVRVDCYCEFYKDVSTNISK